MGRAAYLIENDLSVILPVPWSMSVSFRQQSVGGQTSYLIPVIFTNSWSYKNTQQDSYLICSYILPLKMVTDTCRLENFSRNQHFMYSSELIINWEIFMIFILFVPRLTRSSILFQGCFSKLMSYSSLRLTASTQASCPCRKQIT